MADKALRDVIPANPPAAYIGGKRLLSKTIIERLRSIPHDGYAEPFVGMGGVFLRRPFQPKLEVLNDINGEVANLFRILQRHYPQFMDTLKFQITSRREFERLQRSDPSTLTDLERAARFLYLQRTAFGGKVTGRTSALPERQAVASMSRSSGPCWRMSTNALPASSSRTCPGQRSSSATIGPACSSIWTRHTGATRRTTVQVSSAGRFRADGERLDGPSRAVHSVFERRSRRLRDLQEINIEEVDCTYSVSAGAGKRVREVIICDANVGVIK